MSEIADYGQKTGRVAHVESELQEMPTNTQLLNESLAELETRLQGVLRQDDTARNSTSEPREVLVPIADRIRDQNDIINQATVRVRDIITRLEL